MLVLKIMKPNRSDILLRNLKIIIALLIIIFGFFNILAEDYIDSKNGAKYNLIYAPSPNIPVTILEKVPENIEILTIPEYLYIDNLQYLVTGIENEACRNCKKLDSVVLPPGLKVIGENAFSGCTNLKSIKFPSHLKYILSKAFSNSGITSATLPSRLELLQDAAFKDCKNLRYIVFPQNITEIPSETCYGCNNLQEITIPPSCVKIGKNAFRDCTAVQILQIPFNVKVIEEGAFINLWTLKEALFLSNDTEGFSKSAFDGSNYARILYVPWEAYREYTQLWGDYFNFVEQINVPDKNKYGIIRTDKATQNPISSCYPTQGITSNGVEWVDLGLPSRTVWATCNLGANSPADPGYYYTLGHVNPGSISKSEFSKFLTNLEKNVLKSHYIGGNPQYDAATYNWGRDWRTPTDGEFYELKKHCKWEWKETSYTPKGSSSKISVKGYEVTGPNGNSIFLPASGSIAYNSNNKPIKFNVKGYYWEYEISRGTFAGKFFFDEDGINYVGNTANTGYDEIAHNIRPVSVKTAEELSSI